MTKHLTDINEFLSYFYIIVDNITGETLVSYYDLDGWDGYYEALDLSAIEPSVRFESINDAIPIIEELTKAFGKNGDDTDFSIEKFYYGSELYEGIRSALKEEYGDTLWEYGTDHKMTAAVMRVIVKHGYDREIGVAS